MILVTGASGFIGSAVCTYLQEKGYQVRTAPKDLRLSSTTDWSSALEGVETVIHTAAIVHDMNAEKSRADYEEVNVLGTEQLAKQAALSLVKHFIFLSTIKVLGERTEGRPFTEKDTPNPRGPYAESKLRAEQLLQAVCAHSSLQYTILRLPLVYGPGVRANFRSLIKLVASGLPLPFAGLENRRSFLSLKVLAIMLEKCLQTEKVWGRTLLLSDGKALSTPELIQEIAKAMGRPARLFKVPKSVWPLLYYLGLCDASKASRMLESLELDASSTFAAIGWEPVSFLLEEELKRTVLGVCKE